MGFFTGGTCSVDNCERQACRLGWCSMHYQRWYKRGSLDDPVRVPDAPCSVDDCSKPAAFTNGLCRMHDWRWKNHRSFDIPGSTPPSGTKWCRRCERFLPSAQFYAGKAGPESPCKACRSTGAKQYRRANPPRKYPNRNRRRRAREKAAKSEHYTALEIANRDGWRCQICHTRIGRTFRFPHPRSLSIDHIIPIAQGGDDVKTNVQASHLRCNASKGARGIDQLRLIG